MCVTVCTSVRLCAGWGATWCRQCYSTSVKVSVDVCYSAYSGCYYSVILLVLYYYNLKLVEEAVENVCPVCVVKSTSTIY